MRYGFNKSLLIFVLKFDFVIFFRILKNKSFIFFVSFKIILLINLLYIIILGGENGKIFVLIFFIKFMFFVFFKSLYDCFERLLFLFFFVFIFKSLIVGFFLLSILFIYIVVI